MIAPNAMAAAMVCVTLRVRPWMILAPMATVVDAIPTKRGAVVPPLFTSGAYGTVDAP